MSYDLVFTAGSGNKIEKKTFREYFNGRANYQTGKGQAIYENEDTGVYFIFDEPEDGAVTFNLNYFRAHVFGLEAAPELEQFAEAFEAAVGDPQDEMGEDGLFSREGFLRGWNAGNTFAYRAMLKEQTDPVYTWPSERIEQVWEWNYARRSLQGEAGEDLFVPAIFALEVENQLWSVAIWPPDCPILLPTVDGLLVPVSQSDKESEDMALVRWDALQPIVSPYAAQQQGVRLPAYRLAFQQWPQDIADFLNTARSKVENLNGVGMDQILDQELVEQASTS